MGTLYVVGIGPGAPDHLTDTAKAALEQIRSLSYAASLKARGVPEDRILTYGFAFQGKDVLVEGGKAC